MFFRILLCVMKCLHLLDFSAASCLLPGEFPIRHPAGGRNAPASGL